MKSYSRYLLLISVMALGGCMAKKSTVEQVKTDLDMVATEAQTNSEKIMDLESRNQNLAETNLVLNSEISDLKKELEEVKSIATEAKRLNSLPEGAGYGEFAIHLASYRDVEQVRDGWKTLREKYPVELGALEGVSSSFEVPNGGTFLRIKAGPFVSEEAAQAICDVLETHEQYCMVTNFEGTTLE